jgi:hypothetical protein
MWERAFVLWPLADISPRWAHPETGVTVEGMAAELPRAGLRLYAPAAALEGALEPAAAPPGESVQDSTNGAHR